MKRLYVSICVFGLVGCARQMPPKPMAQVPTPVPVPSATPIVVIAPQMPTPAQPSPESQERLLIITREIERLQSASPQADFERAWAAKDKRFIAIKGAGSYFPAVPESRVLELVNQHGENPIKGTTDVLEFPEQEELGRLAMRYATAYNELLLAKLDEQSTAN